MKLLVVWVLQFLIKLSYVTSTSDLFALFLPIKILQLKSEDWIQNILIQLWRVPKKKSYN